MQTGGMSKNQKGQVTKSQQGKSKSLSHWEQIQNTGMQDDKRKTNKE